MVEISVIMPVYNTFDYLDESLGSIINQSFKDLEIICVDDGSTDESLDKLYSYAAKDDRIQVYHQENQGPGGATNNGLKRATGKYIYLMDSDDILDLNALEECYNLMEENDLDMVIFPAITYYEDTGEYEEEPYIAMAEFSKFISDSVFDWRDIGDYIFKISVTPWSKLYRHDIIKKCGARFPENLIYHDNVFFWQVLFNSNRLYYYNKFLFTMRVHSKSSTHSYDQRNIDTIKIHNLITQVFIDYGHFEEFKEILYNRKINLVLYRYKTTKEEFKDLFFTEMKKDYVKIFDHEKYEDFYSNLYPENKNTFKNVVNSNSRTEFDLRNEILQLKNENGKISREKNNLKKEITNLKAKNKSLKKKYNSLKKKNKSLKKKYNSLKQKDKELNKLNESLLSSKSWKITQPLRTFMNLFRKN